MKLRRCTHPCLYALVLLPAAAGYLGACGPVETPVEPMQPDASVDSSVDSAAPPVDAPGKDVTTSDVDAAGLPDFCSLPGSVVWNNGKPTVVPGNGGSGQDLSWVHLPDGFCVHYFTNLPEVRQLRFAPNGDLFAASPSAGCAGGASGGLGAVVALPDDNHDGVADSQLTYQGNLPQVQGLLFTPGYFYYQSATTIMRAAYSYGDRKAPAAVDQVADITVYVSQDHWPKALDADDMGNIYVTNGGEEAFVCDPTQTPAERPFQGGILMIDPAPGGPNPNGVEVAKGLRNPIALRCAKGTGACFALELAKDFDPAAGSREKLIPVRMGDDWGFPCCATADQQYTDVPGQPDCSDVSPEITSFIIDHTPFGLDFEQGLWSGAWKSRTFVVLHGFFGSWVGARIVGIATEPKTGSKPGWPVPSSEATEDGGTAFSDFATGWDDGNHDHGRPGSVAFAPDGRLFVGNDINGDVLWIAAAKP